jgi:hypothetical protein
LLRQVPGLHFRPALTRTDAREQPLEKVPEAHFDSAQLPPREGLAAWRQMTASLYQTLPQAVSLCDAFLGFLDALLGDGPSQTGRPSVSAVRQFLMTRLQGVVGVEALCRHFNPEGAVERSAPFSSDWFA